MHVQDQFSADIESYHDRSEFPQQTTLSCILWMILMISGGNKLNNVPFLVACFFFSRSFSGKVPSLRFYNFGLLSGVIRFFQSVVGVHLCTV